MKLKFAFVHFLPVGEAAYLRIWICITNKGLDQLGSISWYPRWRQWVYESEEVSVYSADCLTDIAAFITQLNAEKHGYLAASVAGQTLDTKG